MAFSDIISGIMSVPGQALDTIAWFSPPVLIIMFVNLILLIVVIVKGIGLLVEGFKSPGEEIVMYYLPWCGACKKDIVDFKTLSVKYADGITFRLHDIGTSPVTGITASPTYIFTKADGSQVAKIGAYKSLPDMEASFRRMFGVDEYEAAASANMAASSAATTQSVVV